VALPAAAVELVNTGEPGGFFGFYGFDLYPVQSVALAFVPGQDHSLDAISLWLMSNASNPGATLSVSLQTNFGGGAVPNRPSGQALESWSTATQSVGFNPVLQTVDSLLRPVLSANTAYWIVAESTEPGGANPVWVATNGANGPFTVGVLNTLAGPDWQIGANDNPVGAIVNASPVPEPAALFLLLLGVPLVLRAARRA
jgi:hypothetical protein